MTFRSPGEKVNALLQKMKSVSVFLIALLLASCVSDRTLVRQDGSEVRINDLPLVGQHEKLSCYLHDHGHKHLGLAATPLNCPSMYAINWGGSHPDLLARQRCSGAVRKMLADYDSNIFTQCDCVIVLRGRTILRDDIFYRPNKLAPIKFYIKPKNGKVEENRGFLEYERDALVPQKSRILNTKFEELCKGEMNFSLGEGSFDLDCFDGSTKAKGVLAMNGMFSKLHARGSGVFDTGEVFAFITRLNDREIRQQYPDFLK